MNAQEQFWSGEFGREYTKRNRVEWRDRIPFWRQILSITQTRSVLDVGCNVGWNLMAIREIDRTVVTAGIDLNDDAIGEARTNELDVFKLSAIDAGSFFRERYDLVCTSGVLIHVGPSEIEQTMQSIVAASRRWVLAVEYESGKEEEVLYRGNAERLWRRPFGDLYQAMGLRLLADSEAEGFDRCRAWLLCK